MQEQLWAYLAGLIDGDGCIALYKRKDVKAIRGYTYTPYLIITAKDKWFLEYLAETYNGKVNINQVKSGFKTGSFTQSVRFSSNIIRTILPKIIPYLVLKKREAELLLEALNLTENHRKRDTSNDELLENIVMKIKELKKNRSL